MFFDPYLREVHTSAKETIQNLQDVLTWVNNNCDCEETTKNGYRGALLWVSKQARRPLHDIPADRDAVLAKFPDEGFTRDWAKTFRAFRARKKNLSAAINGATGVIAERAARASQIDGWCRLISRLRVLLPTISEPPPALNPHKIISVQALAALARSLNIDACDLTGDVPRELYRAAKDAGQRDACEDAIALMNAVRELDDGELMAALPGTPILFARPRRPEHIEIPTTLSEEIDVWVYVATRGEWSPTDEDYGPGVAAGTYRSAVRKVVKTALAIHAIRSDTETIAHVFANAAMTEVVRTWRKWHFGADPRALTTKTAIGYLECVRTLLERNGEDRSHVDILLKTDLWLSGHRNDMSPSTERFCRRVVRDLQARGDFLGLHVKYRKVAELQLRKAKKFPSNAVKHLIAARSYGTIAAFAAIETDAAPLRIGSALPMTFRGKDPWLNLGSRKNSDGHLIVPAERTKTKKKAISAPISAKNRTRGLETLRWFERNIRPLYPHAEQNDFFFPGVQARNEHLSYATFNKWWNKTIPEFGFPGMTPHMFRHGQASILVANNPGDWSYVMARLGDALSTCMDYYGWIDEERLILEGQKKLTRGLPNV